MKKINDPITRSLNEYAGRLLDRVSYNVEHENWQRAERWAQAYEAINTAAGRVCWTIDEDREDA